MRFFFFGLLRDHDILELVIGRPAPGQPFPRARLADHRLVRLKGDTFPMLMAAPGVHVPGVVVDGLTVADIDRILFFESVEYEPRPITVHTGDVPIEAHAFATTARAVPDQEAWTFEDWRQRHRARDLREARLWMSLHGYVDVSEADRLWDEASDLGRPLEDLVEEVCGGARRAGTRGS